MLTSQELVEKLRESGYKVVAETDSITFYKTFLKHDFCVGRIHINTHRYTLFREVADELLITLTEYILTPFEKRGEVESKYYEIPLFDLVTSDGEQQYLTEKNGKYFASRKDDNLKQKFTKKELKKIPTVYKDFAVTIDEKEEIISD